MKTANTLGIIEESYQVQKREGERFMNGGFITDGTRYIILGIVFVLLLGGIMMMPKRKNYETWVVEVCIVKKEVVENDGEALYLLHTEDSEGKEAVYQITQKALGEGLTAENAHKEIRRKKYYQLKVTEGEKYGCDYPCICGAATLIDGFTQETSAAQ